MVKTYPPEIDKYYGKSKESKMNKDKTIKFIREQLREMHDEFHPEAIFMTQTSSTLYGWTIKEMWKKAWPDEKVPKIFTVDIRPIIYNHLGEKLSGTEPNIDKYKGRLKEILDRLTSNHPYHKEIYFPTEYDEGEFMQIANKSFKEFDEHIRRKKGGQTRREDYANTIAEEIKEPKFNTMSAVYGLINPDWKEVKLTKQKIEQVLKRYHINGDVCIVDEGNLPTYSERGWKGKTLGTAKEIFNEVKDEGYIHGNIGLVGLSKGVYFRKAEKGPWRRKKDNPLAYEIVSTQEDRKEAQERISIYRQFGREMGEEIHQEQQKKKKLENIVSGIIGIASLGLGIFFLSNNITGNAIGNITNSTSNIIGIGLLAIGLAAGFFWLKRR